MYCAVRLSCPSGRPVVISEALAEAALPLCDEPVTGTLPSGVLPEKNVTVPPGGLPKLLVLMVAVKVALAPCPRWMLLALIAVVVEAWVMGEICRRRIAGIEALVTAVLGHQGMRAGIQGEYPVRGCSVAFTIQWVRVRRNISQVIVEAHRSGWFALAGLSCNIRPQIYKSAVGTVGKRCGSIRRQHG